MGYSSAGTDKALKDLQSAWEKSQRQQALDVYKAFPAKPEPWTSGVVSWPATAPIQSPIQVTSPAFMEPKNIDALSKEIARVAHERAYKQAVDDLIDAVIRFGACSCDVDHADECVWGKRLKDIKAWATQALAAAKLLERLK